MVCASRCERSLKAARANLTATVRSSRVSRAFHTSPMPPAQRSDEFIGSDAIASREFRGSIVPVRMNAENEARAPGRAALKPPSARLRFAEVVRRPIVHQHLRLAHE